MFETIAFSQLTQSLVKNRATHSHCDVKEVLPYGSYCFWVILERCIALKLELLPKVKQPIAFACGASTDMWTDDFQKVSYTCIILH